VLLRFETTGDPLLVVGRFGEGRVAAFASDILPHWGSPRFTEWTSYVRFWENVFRWIAGHSTAGGDRPAARAEVSA